MGDKISYELYFCGSELELVERIRQFCRIVGIPIKREVKPLESLSKVEIEFFKEIYSKYAMFKAKNSQVNDITGEVLLSRILQTGTIPEINGHVEYFISVRKVSLDVTFVFIMLRVSENEWYGCYTTSFHEKVRYYLEVLEKLGLLYRSYFAENVEVLAS